MTLEPHIPAVLPPYSEDDVDGSTCRGILKLARDGYDVAIGDIASQQEKVAEVVKEIESYGRKALAVVVGT